MKFIRITVLTTLLLSLSAHTVYDHRCIDFHGKDVEVIKIKGSESELNLIRLFVNEFKKQSPEVSVEITGGGSGLGIRALLDNQVHLANSSRPVNNEELNKAKQKGATLIPVIVGLDAIAIITNPETGIDSLSLLQLRNIFSGKFTNWKQLGGADISIKIFGRNNNSGTHQYLKSRLLIDEYCKNITVKDENSEIIEAVEKIKGAISYINLGSIIDPDGSPLSTIWVVNTYYEGGKSYSPYDKEAVIAGEYPLTRPMYQYLRELPKGKLLELIQFELSDEQQRNNELHGYFPITAIHKIINKKNIPDLVF